MVGSCVLPSIKKQKTVGEQEAGEDEVDRISQLPDSLLHHILSFLPTEKAVRTSILSKRWERLWMSVTSLNFQCIVSSERGDKSKNSRFSNFIERVLLLHSSNISSFRLESKNTLDVTRVYSWISAAVRRQVQELELAFCDQSLLLLPRCLFTSKTLTELKVMMHGVILLPSAICLPSLKNLILWNVKFTDELSINRLFAGLPVLQTLRLSTSSWRRLGNITISLPSLENLSLNIVPTTRVKDGCKVKVSTENLRHFCCTSNLSVDLRLDDMNILDIIVIDIVKPEFSRSRAAYHAANLFGAICFAKYLKVVGRTLECLHHRNFTENVNIFPTFGGLTTLMICTKVTGPGSEVLQDIFRNAPNLESIVIKEVCGGKWNTKPVPHCVKSCLKTCRLLIFNGRPAEVLFVKLLLKNADVLERIKLYCSENLCSHPEKLENIVNQLGMVLKGSERCVVEFIKDHERMASGHAKI